MEFSGPICKTVFAQQGFETMSQRRKNYPRIGQKLILMAMRAFPNAKTKEAELSKSDSTTTVKMIDSDGIDYVLDCSSVSSKIISGVLDRGGIYDQTNTTASAPYSSDE